MRTMDFLKNKIPRITTAAYLIFSVEFPITIKLDKLMPAWVTICNLILMILLIPWNPWKQDFDSAPWGYWSGLASLIEFFLIYSAIRMIVANKWKLKWVIGISMILQITINLIYLILYNPAFDL